MRAMGTLTRYGGGFFSPLPLLYNNLSVKLFLIALYCKVKTKKTQQSYELPMSKRFGDNGKEKEKNGF